MAVKFKKRTVVDTRKQLKDLSQLTPKRIQVTGDHKLGFVVYIKDTLNVHCRNRGEVYVILEALKNILLVCDIRLKDFVSTITKADHDESLKEGRSKETCFKLIEHINQNKACMGMFAHDDKPGEVELVRGSNAKILAKFNTWYRCMIYLRGMCEMLTIPIIKY